MERLRRKFFQLKKNSIRSATNDLYENKPDDNIYLEPKHELIPDITTHFDAIAEELLHIAKKSSHTIRLTKLHDDLLSLKTVVTQRFSETSNDLSDANKQISILRRQISKQRGDIDPENSASTRYNRSFASDRSMADLSNKHNQRLKTDFVSTSYYSIWSPNSSILSSSVTTPIFRRRLAETSISDVNYSSVIQEHFVYLYQHLCSNCSKCSCYQTFIRNQVELEYLSICSYNEQLKCENDLLQRLLADCKYSYEKQYVLFSQYEQNLIEYEQCIQTQHELIRTLQQLIDRFQITTKQKIEGANYDEKNAEIYRTIAALNDQCQQHLSQLPKRAQLFSYSREQFHPPANISGIVDIADLEISILFVDLLTLKHENNELRWTNDRLLREKRAYKSKTAVYELTNKYFQLNLPNNLSADDSSNELIQREKTLRLYVYRLYDLLQTTSKQLEDQQIYYANLIHQFKKRHKEHIDYIQRMEQNRQK